MEPSDDKPSRGTESVTLEGVEGETISCGKRFGEEWVGRLLTGRRVGTSVGEPWDFEGSEAPSALRAGRIVEVLRGEEAGESRSQALKIEVVTPSEAGSGRLVK